MMALAAGKTAAIAFKIATFGMTVGIKGATVAQTMFNLVTKAILSVLSRQQQQPLELLSTTFDWDDIVSGLKTSMTIT